MDASGWGSVKILVTRWIGEDLLKGLAQDHEIVMHSEPTSMPRARFVDELGDAHALLSFLTDRLDVETIDTAPRLRVISQLAAGVDNIDVEACTARRIAVGHTPGVLTEATADAAFALMAAVVRRLPEAATFARSGAWEEWRHDIFIGGDLHGSTLGIVGLGAIGSAVARRAAGFDMRVLYTSRSRRPHIEAALRVSYRSLDDLLAEADHVVIAVPLTPETHQLIGPGELASMKPTSTLVNVARGPVVDTDALLGALEDGTIAGAALDVTDPEPLPADHPLHGQPNCLIVPHIASASRSARRRMLGLAVDNLAAGVAGEPMIRCANPDVYRSGEVGLDDQQDTGAE